MPSAAAIVLGIALFGGGTLGLEPGEPPAVPPPIEEEPTDPVEPTLPAPMVPGSLGVGALAALLAALRRREDLSPSEGLGLGRPVYVFVPGHGQHHGASVFDDLIDLAGIDDESVRHFDYRWVGGGPSHSRASQAVSIDDAASALNAYLAGIAAEGRDVYLVGFSKGGATTAELIADWDDGRWGPSDSVVGAALLDPPIAAGPLGWLQSAGRFVGPVPDDGGYDPVHCSFLFLGCEDRRVGLGLRSGVEVMVIRNPRAAITSFGDVPDGLRIYDADDGGRGPLGQLVRNPFGLPGRIAAAHESVLSDPRVAACIVAEATGAGECGLPRRGAPPLAGLGGGAIRPPSGQKVL
jgi:hypothetical protein